MARKLEFDKKNPLFIIYSTANPKQRIGAILRAKIEEYKKKETATGGTIPQVINLVQQQTPFSMNFFSLKF